MGPYRRAGQPVLHAAPFQPQIGALAGEQVHPLLGEFVRCAREYARQAVAGEASSSANS
jgi:hypothetical protein